MSTTRHCRLFKATTAYTSACTDARAALAPQLSGGPRVPHLQYARRLWPDRGGCSFPRMIAVDVCFRTIPYSMQLTEQISNDHPRMGAKSTTTSNHPSTPRYDRCSDQHW